MWAIIYQSSSSFIRTQVVSGTLYLTTLVKETLILHSWGCSHEKFPEILLDAWPTFSSLQAETDAE